MEELKKIESNAYDYLVDANIHKWARAHSLIQHYNMMTMNIAKLINSALRLPTSSHMYICGVSAQSDAKMVS